MAIDDSAGIRAPDRKLVLTQLVRSHDAMQWLILLALGAAAGLLYGLLFNRWPFVSAFFGMLIGGPILAYERRLLVPALKRWLTAASTLTYVLGTIAVYLVLIVGGNTIAATILWLVGVLPGTYREALHLPPEEFIYSFVVAGTLGFIMRMRDLVGPKVFTSLLVGRYRKPAIEERIFLFVDLIGSTRLAERHGAIAAHRYLSRFFALLAEPVRAHGGSVDDYIGDMAFITWPLEEGVKDARCIRCVIDIATLADKVRDGFGLGPDENPSFRAALHCGPVVTAEVGVYKHKIAYFGDAVNTTARIEDLAKLHEAEFLASREVLDRVSLPPGVTATPLGEQVVHGRSKPVSIVRLDWRSGSTLRQPAPQTALARTA